MSTESVTTLTETVLSLHQELVDPEAPRMGAHTLGQFAYCPRAGLLSAEQSEDTGTELAPALGGLPTHDIDRIRRGLTEVAERMKLPTALTLTLAILALWFGTTWNWLLATPVMWPLYYSVRCLWALIDAYQTLQKRLKLAETAAISEPNWEVDVPQPINWWSLQRAGFDSVEKQTLQDLQLKLAGRPWRVLHRGGCEYPVLRIHVPDDRLDQYRNGRLYRHHLARIAAYAYLLNLCERADSSWAILLFNRSDQGIAVPLTEICWTTFREALVAARQHQQEFGRNMNYAPEPNVGACRRCPFGAPRKSGRQTEVRKRGLAILPFGTENKEGTVYHSQCGDYFRWLVPHEANRDFGLPS